MSMMDSILRLMAERQASDVYLSANSPVLIRIKGDCQPVNAKPLPADAPRALLAEILAPKLLDELDATGELNVGHSVPGVGRFRISGMHQRGSCAAVIRCISFDVPRYDTLGLPPGLADLMLQKRGLLLMVGATGAGKSTTLASLIDHRNELMSGHILTLEDPIEFLFKNKRSVINQREIGTDTRSLQVGLKNALRQAPDVIMIGEIRDRDTMTAAIAYAQSGHLCLATLHANNSHQALNRILSFYPVEVRPTLLGDLAAALKAVVSQRLLRTVSGGRAPAVEVLLNTQLISELIEKGDLSGVKEAMEKSLAEGSQTFEQDIARMVTQGVVSRDEGLANADSPTNLLWRLDNRFDAQAKPPAFPTTQPSAPTALAGFGHITLDLKP